MVDVSGKAPTVREAKALGIVRMSPDAFQALLQGNLPKGEALATCRIAGIMAAKRTWELIPLCHPLNLNKVDVQCKTMEPDQVEITATVRCTGPTGVEMEALTAVTVAALTLYDMLKAVDPGVVLGPFRLLSKTGGKSDYSAPCQTGKPKNRTTTARQSNVRGRPTRKKSTGR